MLTELGTSNIKLIGYFNSPSVIDTEEFIICACVFVSINMSVDAILGTDIHKKTVVHINKNRVV